MSELNTKAFDGKIVVDTLSGIRLNNAKQFGLPIQYREKSTLNEHLDIFTKTPGTESTPVVKYFALGNAGHVASAAGLDDPLPLMLPVAHSPVDAAPWNIVPHVLREVDNDLSDLERKNYALRRQEEHGGKVYWAYYLRAINHVVTESADYHTTVADGEVTVKEFHYTDLNLHPTRPVMPDYDYETDSLVTQDDGDYVSSLATVRIEFTENDIAEFMNVASILYGDPRKSVISEICICSGVGSTETGESAVGSPFTYTEAIGVQVVTFMTFYENLSQQNAGLVYRVKSGNPEPLPLAPGQIPAQIG